MNADIRRFERPQMDTNEHKNSGANGNDLPASEFRLLAPLLELLELLELLPSFSYGNIDYREMYCLPS